MDDSGLRRFISAYTVDEESGCHLWMRPLDRGGYGHFKVCGRTRLAHRAIFEHLHGPLPAGMHVHHICRTRHCVNPLHMEARSPQSHLHEHLSYAAKHNLCCRGHLVEGDNLQWAFVAKKGRHMPRCRQCLLDIKRTLRGRPEIKAKNATYNHAWEKRNRKARTDYRRAYYHRNKERILARQRELRAERQSRDTVLASNRAENIRRF